MLEPQFDLTIPALEGEEGDLKSPPPLPRLVRADETFDLLCNNEEVLSSPIDVSVALTESCIVRPQPLHPTPSFIASSLMHLHYGHSSNTDVSVKTEDVVATRKRKCATPKSASSPAKRMTGESMRKSIQEVAIKPFFEALNSVEDSKYASTCLRRIGSGSFGIVNCDERSETVCKMANMDDFDISFFVECIVMRYINDAQRTSEIRNVGNVPLSNSASLKECFPYKSNLTMVMDYKGRDLTFFQKGVSSVEQLQIVRSLLSELVFIGDLGIVHGDIKPANVVVQDNKATFVDWGLARLNTDVVPADVLIYTIGYRPPELMYTVDWHSETDLLKADVFATGMTILEMLVPKFRFKNVLRSSLSSWNTEWLDISLYENMEQRIQTFEKNRSFYDKFPSSSKRMENKRRVYYAAKSVKTAIKDYMDSKRCKLDSKMQQRDTRVRMLMEYAKTIIDHGSSSERDPVYYIIAMQIYIQAIGISSESRRIYSTLRYCRTSTMDPSIISAAKKVHPELPILLQRMLHWNPESRISFREIQNSPLLKGIQGAIRANVDTDDCIGGDGSKKSDKTAKVLKSSSDKTLFDIRERLRGKPKGYFRRHVLDKFAEHTFKAYMCEKAKKKESLLPVQVSVYRTVCRLIMYKLFGIWEDDIRTMGVTIQAIQRAENVTSFHEVCSTLNYDIVKVLMKSEIFQLWKKFENSFTLTCIDQELLS